MGSPGTKSKTGKYPGAVYFWDRLRVKQENGVEQERKRLELYCLVDFGSQ